MQITMCRRSRKKTVRICNRDCTVIPTVSKTEMRPQFRSITPPILVQNIVTPSKPLYSALTLARSSETHDLRSEGDRTFRNAWSVGQS